jgi:SAM-dependent methyltransferase
MSALNEIPLGLEKYQPQRPLAELIERVNQIFHNCEARDYDRRHGEMNGEWADLWRELIDVADLHQPKQAWHILDFGCGTGFASLQLVQRLPPASIASLTCYDLSQAMLAQCRAKVAAVYPAARFCYDFRALDAFGPFNLLATNALLHHLPDPGRTLNEVSQHLTSDAVWLAGKEPSARFFRNPACVRHLEQYRHARKTAWQKSARRYLLPSYWRKKFADLFRPSPKKQTARLAHAEGLFKCRPSDQVVDRLVDYHVLHSTSDAAVGRGRGLDIDALQTQLAPDWTAAWVKSFSFLGNELESELPPTWRQACADLAVRYPADGAYFAAIWRRRAASCFQGRRPEKLEFAETQQLPANSVSRAATVCV